MVFVIDVQVIVKNAQTKTHVSNVKKNLFTKENVSHVQKDFMIKKVYVMVVN